MSDVLGKCPVCGDSNGGEISEKKASFACSKAEWVNEGTQESPVWKNNGCNFSIYKKALERNGGSELSAEQVSDLLSGKEVLVELNMKRPIEIDTQYGVKVNLFKK